MSKLIILSGAGLSAESGIATFRDKDGFWGRHRVEEICDISTWQRNYDLVHRFYNERRLQLGQVQPNLMHQMIAEWEASYPTTLLTQNVDDLLERAGCREVVHVHGFITEIECTGCLHRWDIGYTEWKEEDSCPHCEYRELIKPGVVFFGEQAPLYTTLFEAVNNPRDEDVLLVIGTMGTVLPINSIAENACCHTILNNLAPNEMIDDANFDHVFYEPATQAAPKIDALLKKLLG